MTKRKPRITSTAHHHKAAKHRAPQRDTIPVQANGWTLLFEAKLLDQLERLTTAAAAERHRRAARPDTNNRRGTAATTNVKVLAAVNHLMFEEIPQDPKRPEYRQVVTLGAGRTHWFRAKFGGGRFRLFFRFRSDVRLIVYAWVNDEETLRTYGSSADAYRVFADMLDQGNPPDDWDALVAACKEASIQARGRATRS